VRDFRVGSAYLKTLLIFGLLFVYYSQTEVDLIRLVEFWCHAHDLRERFFGMIQRAITIIQYANTVPQLGFLQILLVLTRYVRTSKLPLDHADCTEPTGRLCKLVGARPSSGNNDLGRLLDCGAGTKTRHVPRLLQLSPSAEFSARMFRM